MLPLFVLVRGEELHQRLHELERLSARIEEGLDPEAVHHCRHHGYFVVCAEFLAVLGGEPCAGEVVAHFFSARDEKVVGGVAWICCRDGDGKPVPLLVRCANSSRRTLVSTCSLGTFDSMMRRASSESSASRCARAARRSSSLVAKWRSNAAWVTFARAAMSLRDARS